MATDKTSAQFYEEAIHEETSGASNVVGQTFYQPETSEAKALDRAVNLKLDFAILTVLAINFILCGIDKTNIGYVATTTFVKDAHLKPNDVSNSVSLLSVTFVVLQPFSTALGRRIGPKYWIPSMMLMWGAICMAHAGVKSRGTLIALRLLLGAAEAGFVPTTFYYLSTVYPKYSLGTRLGLFSGMYSIAGAFAGLIAYGIFQIKTTTVHTWQILFLLEGGLSILMGVVTFFLLPHDLNNAWFLTPRQRSHAVARMQADIGAVAGGFGVLESGTNVDTSITKRDILDAITDWPKMITIVFNISATLPVSAFGTFMPLIVRGLGYAGVEASLMSVSPFAVGAVGLVIFVIISDKTKERSIVVTCSIGVAMIGLIVMAVSDNPRLRYGFVHVALAGAFTAGPLIVAWLVTNSPEKGPRSLIIGMNGYSNIAGVIAGQLFKSVYAPSYKYPLIVTMILIAVSAIGFLSIRVLYMMINRARAKKMQGWSEEEYKAEALQEKRRGHQKVTFRYGY